MICEHGYTANFDCPVCPCPCGSGKPCGDCVCEEVCPDCLANPCKPACPSKVPA